MKNLISISALVLVFWGATITPAICQTHEQLFQNGLQKEEGEGALNEAIDIYYTIVLDENADREIQARALLHIGLCKQKLGNEEARQAYQRIINEFSEQKDLVELAHGLLSRLQDPDPEAKSPRGIMLQQIWTGPNVDGGGSVSPDGRFLSYWDYETGNLGYKNMINGDARLLTTEGTYEGQMQFTINSTISPDGKQIAYSWYNLDATYEIRIIDLANPKPRILYSKSDEEVYPVSWSTDGKQLLVRRFGDSIHCQISILEVSSGDIRGIKTFLDGYWMGMSYSSDNQYIAYDAPIYEEDGNFDIFVITQDGKEESHIIEHPANDRLLGWIPRYDDILFISDRTGTWDAWIQPMQDGKVSGPPKKVLPRLGQVGSLGFTQNDDLYYGILSRKHTTLIAPLNDTTFLPDIKLAKPLVGSKYQVEFSPNGQYLAYVKEYIEPAGPGWYSRPLHIMSQIIDQESILGSNLEARYPRWSNDGTRILCVGYNRDTFDIQDYYGGIYEFNIQNELAREIVRFPDYEIENIYGWNQSVVEWAKDDQSIYYINGPGIVHRQLENGEEVMLLQQENLGTILDLSPDGINLLFASDPSEEIQGQLHSISVTDGMVRDLCFSQDADKIQTAAWSPDGNYIFFSENMEKGSVLWRVTKLGESPLKVWEFANESSYVSIDRSGNNIAVANFMQEQEIWMMKNLLSVITNSE